MSTTKLADALPPLPDVELAEIRNDSINKTRLSETGAHYWGSNWREVRKLYTAEQMRDYALAAVAQAEAKPAPAPIHVSVGCMKESNGRETWVVMLTPSPDTPLTEAFQVYSSASEGRARYTAADLLHCMGLGPMPDPTAFDTELPAAPAAPAPEPLTIPEVCDLVDEAGLDWQKGWPVSPSECNRFLQLATLVQKACLNKWGIAASKGGN
jgi:hypothetical protein